MGDVLGVGVTHYPPLLGPPSGFSHILKGFVLRSPRVPEALKDPKTWPEPMQAEFAHEAERAAEHQARLIDGFRRVRRAIDDFRPDAVIIFGDDQYENFREDCIPPFNIFLTDEMVSRPFALGSRGRDNPWQEPPEKAFVHRGAKAIGQQIATELIEGDFPIAFSFINAHFAARGGPTMLTHAFLNALLFLDWDRRGFGYPVVPVQVNCYGRDVIASRGGFAHLNLDGPTKPFGDELAPPGPTPRTCFELGRRVRAILDGLPGRYVVMASSSWSHAFLVAKHHWRWPDLDFDREHLADLEAGRQAGWAKLTNAQIDDAGDQEFKNWICLAGAVADRRAIVIDYLPTHVFNSPKCFALFPPNDQTTR